MDEAAVRALAQRFVPGKGEPVIRALQSGLVNASYRVTRDAQDFVLRARAARGEAPGVNRDWERRVLECVCAAGLAPIVVRCEPANEVLVTRWVEGTVWSAAQTALPAVSTLVADLARAVHRLPPPQPARAMNPALWRDLYLDALRRVELDSARRARVRAWDEQALQLLADYAALQAPDSCLCHSDLHRHNIVTGPQGLVLLDWEYAHVGDPFWDLAGWVSCADLNAATSEHFLSAYLLAEPMAAQRRRLRLLCGAYDFICLLWIELYRAVMRDADGASADSLSERSNQLAARFTQTSRQLF